MRRGDRKYIDHFGRLPLQTHDLQSDAGEQKSLSIAESEQREVETSLLLWKQRSLLSLLARPARTPE